MMNIAITGKSGRVGKELIQLLKEQPTIHLAAELNRQQITNGLRDIQTPIDLIIDFSRPEATLALLPVCCDRGYGMVIGTTGFTEAEKQKIIEASKRIPIILSPNMSVGINLSYKLMAQAASVLEDLSPDIAILDIHHQHKKDSPSGTALRMKEVITSQFKDSTKNAKIELSSLRLGDTVGEHTVKFALEGESLEIRHLATNRSLYAKGAIKAAQWLMNKPAGLYDMQDVLY